MKKKYSLPILPEDLILILDNSAFNLEDYLEIYKSKENKNFPISYLKCCLSRLEELTKKLSYMDNWTTTEEIVEEFRRGNNFFKRKMEKSNCRQTASAYKRILNQRKKTMEILPDKNRLINNNLTEELTEIINKSQLKIEKIFNPLKDIEKNRRTDIKLINVTLAYANYEPVCLFSNDIYLIRSFIKCSQEFNLSENSYALTDRIYKPVRITNITLSKRKIKFKTDEKIIVI